MGSFGIDTAVRSLLDIVAQIGRSSRPTTPPLPAAVDCCVGRDGTKRGRRIHNSVVRCWGGIGISRLLALFRHLPARLG